MRPISNVVDVTNYVMLEYGQPLHAFDFNKLRGRQIIVRRARADEVMTTLDGSDRTLKSNLLVIADKERAVAVAGIMGGADSEVTDSTTTVLIESANFNRAAVHAGSLELKLSTEASLRFEKGLSPELAMVALKRATQLMQELTGAKVAKGIIDVYPGKKQIEPITLSIGEVQRLLGIEMKTPDMVEALELLGFRCSLKKASQQVEVNVPWWRVDVTCRADLVEELARVLGYENIPTTMLSSALPSYEPTPALSLRQRIRSIMVSCGFQEILTYSLTSMEVMQKVLPQLNTMGSQPLKVANPMSREMEYLRATLRSGVLAILARNQRYQQRGYKLFELGKVFLPQQGTLPQEKEMLCVVLSGSQDELFWRGGAESSDFFVAKGVVESLLSRLGLVASFSPGNDNGLRPGRNATIAIGNEIIGIIGELHPKVRATFDLTETAFLIELDVEKILPMVMTTYRYQPIPKYPSVTRDIALVLDESVTYQQVYNIVCDSPLVTQISLFDLYRGEQVPAGKKSLAFRIMYQSGTHTLSDKEVDEVQQRFLVRLAKELGAALRV